MADPHPSTDAAEHDADAYQHGSMTIEEQKATWKLVQALFSWGSVAIASMLLFLVIWFQPGGNGFAGFIAGLVVFIAGAVFLRSGSKAH